MVSRPTSTRPPSSSSATCATARSSRAASTERTPSSISQLRSVSRSRCTRSSTTPHLRQRARCRHRSPAGARGARPADEDRRAVVDDDLRGEGLYRCVHEGRDVAPPLREEAQLAARSWAMRCPSCGQALEPLPTPESKPLNPNSIYAIGKRDHEEMFLAIGRAYDVPVTALRLFNVYGPRQALFEPLHGRGCHLRLTTAQRARSGHLRGRPAGP